MECWVDLFSGTWGTGPTVSVHLSNEEADVFGELTDLQRIDVARVMSENDDDPDFDLYSALAALGI